MGSSNDNVLLPMQVDCFVLNEAVCSPKRPESAKIAPIVQPNYTFLRYDQKYLSSDILSNTDLHGSIKASSNSRITDLVDGKTIRNRLGVYVHWMLPRPYRTGFATSKADEPKSQGEESQSALPSESDKTDTTAPRFPDIPTRWLVIRHLALGTVKPSEAVNKKLIPEIEAWIVESDRKQVVDNLGEAVDLQTDVSPYVEPGQSKPKTENGPLLDDVDIEHQAEVFIGARFAAQDWKGEQQEREGIKLNLSQSSNQLFADFQPHNSNVFSLIDRFEYVENNEKKSIQSGRASYYVMGWHSDPKDDLFCPQAGMESKYERGSHLDELRLALSNESAAWIQQWRKSVSAVSTLCHGARYDVLWDLKAKPSVPADRTCEMLMRDGNVSVGTTPLDAILAYLHAHEANLPTEVRNVRETIRKMEAWLIARDEGTEPMQNATARIRAANFKKSDGGRHLYYASTNENATGVPGIPYTQVDQQLPPQERLEELAKLNQMVCQLDGMKRMGKNLRWDLFAAWWNFVTDLAQNRSTTDVRKDRDDINRRLQPLLKEKLNKLEAEIDAKITNFAKAQNGTLGAFSQPNDPTILIAGIPSAWPHDYLEKLKVRLESQTLAEPEVDTLPDSWQTFARTVLEKVVPSRVQRTSKRAYNEFFLLRPENPVTPPPADRIVPLYHDILPRVRDSGVEKWRDRWNEEQPFFPLYFEWEVEYIHIPFVYWRFHDSTFEPNMPSTAQYEIDVQKFLGDKPIDIPESSKNIEGRRVLSGRSLILPQPIFSLESKIKALLASLPKAKAEELLPEKEWDKFRGQLHLLPFLSASMNGFHDHLLTRLTGTHVKPNNLTPDGQSIPIKSAIAATKDPYSKDPDHPEYLFQAEHLSLIEAESDSTPYGSQIQFVDETFPPFKPATHGQFRFTKLNVFDKFGQVVHAVNPDIRATRKYTVPCTGDYFAAQKIFARDPAEKDPERPDSAYEFVQIPPQINQPARLNASWCELFAPEQGNMYWRPLSQWQSPVWGWVVINYANHGLQFFLADGTFYREIRLGGPSGSQASAKWLPFNPASKLDSDPAARQLQQLIDRLRGNAVYLRGFASMIALAMKTLVPAPAEYAQQSSSVVGRPLALASMSWSLELAAEPYATTILRGNKNVRLKLAEQDSLETSDDTKYYEFTMKLGSREKAYDGLVGYFPARPVISRTEKPATIGDALDLDQLFTHYASATPEKPIRLIDANNSAKLRAFYFDPTRRNASTLDILRNKWQQAFGAILDPFAAVHAFTAILPIQELRLEPWIYQTAFSKITTFLSMGPLLLQTDIAQASDAKQQRVREMVETGPAAKEPELGAPVPVSAAGRWQWLQPYFDETKEETDKGTYYNRFKLEKTDPVPRLEDPPYVAIEGYLQLTKPISDTSKGT